MASQWLVLKNVPTNTCSKRAVKRIIHIYIIVTYLYIHACPSLCGEYECEPVHPVPRKGNQDPENELTTIMSFANDTEHLIHIS